jgi:lysophospholipase L1-like esterase
MNDYETYTILGDSVAQGYFDETGKGWVVRLFEMLNADKPSGYYYSHLSHSGDRIYDHYHRLCAEALSRDNDNLIITLTDNDLIRHGETSEAPINISIPLQIELWSKLLKRAKSNFKKIYVIGCSPNPEGEPFIFNGVKMWTTNKDLAEHQSRIKSLCDQHDIPFIDIYDDLNHDEFLNTMDDGTHPNTEGHIMIAELAYKKFKEAGV